MSYPLEYSAIRVLIAAQSAERHAPSLKLTFVSSVRLCSNSQKLLRLVVQLQTLVCPCCCAAKSICLFCSLLLLLFEFKTRLNKSL